MRRALLWIVGLVALVGATGGLLWFSTATAARFTVEGDRLHVAGQLTLMSTERLNTILEENGDLSTLVLGEIGAGSDATSLLQKGNLVRAAGLSTEVAPGVSLTGDAVYLFLAGITRTLGSGAAIGVDGWETSVGPAARLPSDHPAHEERLEYVTRMLGAGDFYWFTLEAGGELPHFMTRGELGEFGVVTSE